MSWIDKLTNDLIITTGDSQRYKPLWMRPTKSTEFNYAEFKFPNLSGSLVVRGTPIGRRFPLEIFFVGENHLDEASKFETSANDKRAWRLEHPYYGLIFVQPTSISFDNTGENVSKVSIQVIETITEDYPKGKSDPLQSILLQKIELDGLAERDITATIQTTDVNKMTNVNKKAFSFSVPIIELPEELTEYTDLFNKVNSVVTTAIASPVSAMRGIIALLNYPANLQSNVQDRINTLSSTFTELRKTLTGMTGVASKQIYQTQGTSIISSMCIAAVTPLDKDYTNSKKVMNISDTIIEQYNNFMADLDLLQSTNGGNTTSFIPSPDTIIALNDLVNFTISNLYSIALSSRTERSIITEKDTNIILLTHRFYGLDPNDDNINELFYNNNWGLNHILQIKKNTKVVYFI